MISVFGPCNHGGWCLFRFKLEDESALGFKCAINFCVISGVLAQELSIVFLFLNANDFVKRNWC